VTNRDKQLLAELAYGIITGDVFIRNFSVDIKNNPDFVRNEVRAAIESEDPEELQMTISLIWLSGDIPRYVDLLNELLIDPRHTSHQLIAKTLQDVAPSATTVPFVRKALESDFDYLGYTCSESGVIAKWFSWLLYSIATKEAMDLMKEFSNSSDQGIANEMFYRLRKAESNSSNRSPAD
jgi:hypothetical protein